MSFLTHPTKITIAEMREQGVRGHPGLMQHRSGQHAVGLRLRNAETRVHVADEALN
jgi:hypothetical protein